MTLKSGWIGENNGICKWPTLIYKDIANYMSMLGPEFISKLEREYKLGKAYRYFSCEFVREVYYNDIEDKSPFCLLKCRVVPSQRTSSKPYHVWACLKKDIGENPGGAVMAAYCTCTAGLKGTCNHVVALLFRVDNAVVTGMTKLSKTSKLCTWNVPSGAKVNVQPTQVSEMTFKQGHYTSASDRNFEKEKEGFLTFAPSLYDEHISELNNESTFRNKLYLSIKDEIKTSRFAELMESKPLNRPEVATYDLPETLMDKAESFFYDENFSLEHNIKIFTNSLVVTEKQINDIKKLTSKQNINTEWGHYRAGHLTASIFQRINSRVQTLKVSQGDPKALVDVVIGNSKFTQTKQMKYGKALEPHALRKYTYVMTKSRSHQNFKVSEIGLILDMDYPFLGASPDMEISCDCCGIGVGEIKCPYSVLDQVPSADNLPYLEAKQQNGSEFVTLKNKHQYYFQIQGQMPLTRTSYCDFFVYSKPSYIILKE